MIPIRYHNTVNTDYDDFVEVFKSKVDIWLRNGYIGNKHQLKAKTWKAKCSRLNGEQKRKFKSLFQRLSILSPEADFRVCEWILDTPTREFLKYIRGNVKIDDIINKSLAELKGIDAAIKRDGRFGDFTYKTSALYKNVYHAFVEMGYEKNIKKDKFIDAIGI